MTNHRTALVTGATRGIGLALARRLAASGWSVVGIARHASDDFPGRLLCCDLADPAQTAETLRGLLSESAVDALVNNAGIALPQSLENLDLAALQQVFDLNVRVAVQLAQACLPGLKRSPAGRIVNLCSRAIHGARERTAYAAAKSALVGVTRTWALGWRRWASRSTRWRPGRSRPSCSARPARSAARRNGGFSRPSPCSGSGGRTKWPR